MITERAYAKINLCLDVTGKRPDGYHDVRMIMQMVDIFDALSLSKTDSGITIDVGGSPLPEDGDNLICKAARKIMDRCGIKGGVSISLEKHIPIAAGMAGGSSDAAATLRGMNRLYECGLTNEELREIGVTIGADVPYCIEGGTVLAEGIGEKLTFLEPLPGYILAVAKPEAGVSTGNIYTALDEIFDTILHPDIDGMLNTMRTCRGTGFLKYLGNVLEYVTEPRCPEVEKIKDVFGDMGSSGTLMTGSGPTVYGFFEDEEKAARAVSEVRRLGYAGEAESFVTRLITPVYD
ncbi:MAG: 4-(cytidine 5'-diphospho)-2-C-methyl-D-erythritol kinase [Lachnospiraceae bacterium]|nr:4-(cytidine 5'-diphospho)-2-C-methyl-D-erythritol kinase [Lachnospiraceae bacterium]